MARITQRDLDRMADRINRATGAPLQAWTGEGGKRQASVGHYYIASAYGGYSLERIENIDGGTSSPLETGHLPARDLHRIMQAYLIGLRQAKSKSAESAQ